MAWFDRAGELSYSLGVGEALGAGQLGAAIGDYDSPAEQGGHFDQRLCVFAGAEDYQALGREKLLDEAAFVLVAGIEG